MRPLWTIIYCMKLYGHSNALFLTIPLPTPGPGNHEELAWLPRGASAMSPCPLLDFWVIVMRNNWVTFQDSTKLILSEQKTEKAAAVLQRSAHPLPSRGLPPLVNHFSTNMPTKTLALVLVQGCIVIILLEGEPGHSNNQLQHHNDCPCRRCI